MNTLTNTVLAAGVAALSAAAGASATVSFSFSTGTPVYQPVYRAPAPVCRNVVRYDFFGQPYWDRVCENVRRAAVVPAPVYTTDYVFGNDDDDTVYYNNGSYYNSSYNNGYYNNGYNNPVYRNPYPNVPTTIIRNPQNNATTVEQYSAPVRLR